MQAHHTEILKVFRNAGALLEGHFLLSSGLHSPKYLQCARVLEDPARAGSLCSRLARAFHDDRIQVVIGPALGGILVAYELARALGCRALFAERVDGRMTLRRGFHIDAGERVLLAEDVVTTGGSLREIQTMALEAGADIVAVAALVDRTSGRDPGFGMPLASLVKVDVPAFTPEDCPMCKEGLPLVKPGSRAKPGQA